MHYIPFVLGAALKFGFIKVFALFRVFPVIRVNLLARGQHITKVRLLVGRRHRAPIPRRHRDKSPHSGDRICPGATRYRRVQPPRAERGITGVGDFSHRARCAAAGMRADHSD